LFIFFDFFLNEISPLAGISNKFEINQNIMCFIKTIDKSQNIC
jgi:hypothetical protein